MGHIRSVYGIVEVERDLTKVVLNDFVFQKCPLLSNSYALRIGLSVVRHRRIYNSPYNF